MKTKSLPIEDIRTDGGTQPRSATNQHVVVEYADNYKAGVAMPPVDVFHDGIEYWLADGFHRVLACIQNGTDKIECVIHTGTVEDAQWFAVSANKQHGLHRSNADKRKVAEIALLHQQAASLSDSQIADHVGVSHTFIASVRKQLEHDGRLETVASRTGKDGRTINTENIGKAVEEDEPEEESEWTSDEEPDYDDEPESTSDYLADAEDQAEEEEDPSEEAIQSNSTATYNARAKAIAKNHGRPEEIKEVFVLAAKIARIADTSMNAVLELVFDIVNEHPIAVAAARMENLETE